MFGKYMNVKAQHLNLLSNCIMHYTVQCIAPLHNHYTTQCIMQLYKELYCTNNSSTGEYNV